jgi:hypothetical protein
LQEEALKVKLKKDELFENRRQKMISLYSSDMENWKQEALSKVESLEERKQRLLDFTN